jgi:gamma-glutamylcyclotransferase (GGCT)/AIG2-like uncharacterized protein YtfP
MAQDRAQFSDSDLSALRRLNELRRSSALVAAKPELAEKDELEAQFATRFSSDCRLAVYGSLAPGRSNHHVIADVPGEWVERLIVHGELVTTGWGAAFGYRALRWQWDGPVVQVALFTSQHLPVHWPRLDEFEGEEYRRILVPVYREGQFVAVANLYEADSD